VYVKACGLKSPRVYAPVPTGFSTTSAVGSTSAHRCSGTIGTPDSTSGPCTKAGASKVKVTWVSSVAVAVPA
jgi:hypothetical protein